MSYEIYAFFRFAFFTAFLDISDDVIHVNLIKL